MERGISFESVIRRWGNFAGIVIPKEAMEKLGFNVGDWVIVKVQKRKSKV